MAILKAHNSFLSANGNVLVKKNMNSITFDYITDAPSFTGSFENITYNGSKLSKVTRGTTKIYFTPDKSKLSVTKFNLYFKRLVYSFNSIGANRIILRCPDTLILERAHHNYNREYYTKKQIMYDFNWELFNGAYLTTNYFDTSWQKRVVVIDQPFYDVLDEFVLKYDGSTIKIFCNGTLYASTSGIRTSINEFEIHIESGTNGIAVGEFKLEYI